MSLYDDGIATALENLGIKVAEESGYGHYGIPTALGLGAGGLAYSLLRKQRVAADPILRVIQKASGGKLTALDYSTKGPAFAETMGKHPQGWMPDWLRRPLIRMTRGADDVILHKLTPEQLPERADALKRLGRGRKPKRIAAQPIEGAVINQGEPLLHQRYRGETNPTGNIADALRLGSDKHLEAQFLQQHMPGMGPAPLGLIDEYLSPAIRKADSAQQIAALQQALKTKQPKGFVIKPRGGAATGTVIKGTDDLTQLLTDPGTKGRWIRDMLQNPQQYVVQESIPIATERRLPFIGRKHHAGQADLPVEYRVHTVGGRIVPGAISRRYGTVGGLNPLKTYREKKELVRQLQPMLDKLPPQYRQEMMMGIDIVKTPGGQYRIIETNPMGGQSGFLQPDMTYVPTLAPHKVYKAITGRESKPLAATQALLGGGLAAGAGYAATEKLGLDTSDTAQLGAAAAVGATPFAGLIGRWRLQHDPLQNPNIPRYASLDELKKVIQPGDVFVGSGGPSGWQLRHRLFSGSPFYHGGIVLGGNKTPRVLPVNELLSLYDDPAKVTLRDLPGFTSGLIDAKYPNVVVMRSKGPTLSPEELETLKRDVAQRSRGGYGKVTTNWLRELFLPKSRFLEKITEPVAPACVGGTCSTVPAQAHYAATGRSIGETAPRTTTPADLLTSSRLEPVGAHLTEPFLAQHSKRPWLAQARRLGTRGMVGLGLGGLAYSAIDDPLATTVGVGGTLLTPKIIRKALRATRKSPEGPAAVAKEVRSAIPEVSTSNLNWMYSNKGTKDYRLLRNLTRRTIPLALGGGILSYLGTKKLKNALTEE